MEHKHFTSVVVAGAFVAAGYAEVSPYRIDYSPLSDWPAISRPDFFTSIQGTTSSTGVVLDIRDYMVAMSSQPPVFRVFPCVHDV